jgi:osmotically-inducible protein OsmY
MRQRWIGGLGVVLWLIGTGAAFAAQRHIPLTDDHIRASVEHNLFDAGLVGVKVSVHDGDVTLAGTVPSLWAKDEAVRQARKVSDVKEVAVSLGVARAESETDLAQSVGHALRGSAFLTMFDDVNGMVTNGVATLTGAVTTPYKAHEVTEAVSRVEGVQEIVDRIEILPASTFDDQIRYAVASRIYNHPMFWQYSIHAIPPIRIIVRNGHVTLAGVVPTEMDRRVAESLAREVFGVLGVENALRTER